MEHTTPIQQAMVTALKGHAPLAALVGDRVYSAVVKDPKWPFIRIDNPIELPYSESCGDGFEIEWPIRAFARGPDRRQINEIKGLLYSFFEQGFVASDFRRLDIDFAGANVVNDRESLSDYMLMMTIRTVSVEATS